MDDPKTTQALLTVTAMPVSPTSPYCRFNWSLCPEALIFVDDSTTAMVSSLGIVSRVTGISLTSFSSVICESNIVTDLEPLQE